MEVEDDPQVIPAPVLSDTETNIMAWLLDFASYLGDEDMVNALPLSPCSQYPLIRRRVLHHLARIALSEQPPGLEIDEKLVHVVSEMALLGQSSITDNVFQILLTLKSQAVLMFIRDKDKVDIIGAKKALDSWFPDKADIYPHPPNIFERKSRITKTRADLDCAIEYCNQLQQGRRNLRPNAMIKGRPVYGDENSIAGYLELNRNPNHLNSIRRDLLERMNTWMLSTEKPFLQVIAELDAANLLTKYIFRAPLCLSSPLTDAHRVLKQLISEEEYLEEMRKNESNDEKNLLIPNDGEGSLLPQSQELDLTLTSNPVQSSIHNSSPKKSQNLLSENISQSPTQLKSPSKATTPSHGEASSVTDAAGPSRRRQGRSSKNTINPPLISNPSVLPSHSSPRQPSKRSSDDQRPPQPLRSQSIPNDVMTPMLSASQDASVVSITPTSSQHRVAEAQKEALVAPLLERAGDSDAGSRHHPLVESLSTSVVLARKRKHTSLGDDSDHSEENDKELQNLIKETNNRSKNTMEHYIQLAERNQPRIIMPSLPVATTTQSPQRVGASVVFSKLGVNSLIPVPKQPRLSGLERSVRRGTSRFPRVNDSQESGERVHWSDDDDQPSSTQ